MRKLGTAVATAIASLEPIGSLFLIDTRTAREMHKPSRLTTGRVLQAIFMFAPMAWP